MCVSQWLIAFSIIFLFLTEINHTLLLNGTYILEVELSREKELLMVYGTTASGQSNLLFEVAPLFTVLAVALPFRGSENAMSPSCTAAILKVQI